MTNLDPEVEAAFRRMSAALDEVWLLCRDRGAQLRVDTLSTSLADPVGFEVAVLLMKMTQTVENNRERLAIRALAEAAKKSGLLGEGTFKRVIAATE
jgi:hypothetical protein